MIEILVGTFSTLAGVVVGTMAEAIRSKDTFWRERRWEREVERRKRLDELYGAIEEIELGTALAIVDAAIALNSGTVPPPRSGPTLPYSKVGMLVGLYASELAPHRVALMKARDAVGACLVRCIQERSADRATKSRALSLLKGESDKLSGVCNGFREALVEAVRVHDERLKAGDTGRTGAWALTRKAAS